MTAVPGHGSRRQPTSDSGHLPSEGGPAAVIALSQLSLSLDLDLVLDATGAVTFQLDFHTGKVAVSANFERILGLEAGSFDGSHEQLLSVFHPNDRLRLELGHLRALAPGTIIQDEYTVRLPGEEERRFQARGCVVADLAGEARALVGVAVDDTVRFEADRARSIDPLTGLPNKAFLTDRLQERLERRPVQAATVGVFCILIDRLRDLDDGFGRRVGDQALNEIAARLVTASSPSDIVGRFGGDELVVVRDMAAAEALAFARRLTSSVGPTISIDGRNIPVSASAGVVVTDLLGPGAEELLQDAAIAAHSAAERGAGQVELFEPTMRRTAEARLDCETELRRALDRQTLQVWYQPIVSVQSGRLIGAEALVRWPHPERGMVPPVHFVAAAERCGLICALGEIVLRTACQDVAGWRRRKALRDLTVSVNVSSLQLTDPGFVEVVRDCLSISGLDPEALCLELTESVLTRPTTAVTVALDRVRSLGVSIAADDFGTGYSSLAYLREFPIQVLKLDRSFVAGTGQSLTDTAIVRCTIELARALGLTSVAEGVETQAQLDCLRDMGCDQAQGYLWAAPVPAPEFLERSGRRRSGNPVQGVVTVSTSPAISSPGRQYRLQTPPR